MVESFEHRDMAGSVFRDVNLQGAIFDDVNLAGASIHNANLLNVTITDAGIRGLTIFGLRVDELIEAELDRRDPVRRSLRMADPYDPACLRTVMARLDQLRAGFYAGLRAAEPERLVAWPGPGEWSAIEIVRHLVFAEDLYLNRWILGSDRPWCRLALRPDFLARDPRYAEVGSEPTEDLEAVLAAWEGIHARTQEVVARLTAEELRRDTSDRDFGQGTVGKILQGMAMHDLEHIRDAEALLAR